MLQVQLCVSGPVVRGGGRLAQWGSSRTQRQCQPLQPGDPGPHVALQDWRCSVLWFLSLLLVISQFLTCVGFSHPVLSAPSHLHSSLSSAQTDINYVPESPSGVFSALLGAAEPLCPPAGDACCYDAAPLLACASWFEGKHQAALGSL